ncbi:hypothetical protein HYX02_05190 [Candidatus Woesearchaeota archaeon]|nr:hypothetical protein [Candidatus Woesearchaeota archaeon]
MVEDDLSRLSEIENKIKFYWSDVVKRIKRDIAYIWTDEVKHDFRELKDKVKRVAFILKRLHNYYRTDKYRYSKEISDIRILITHINRVKSKSEWIRLIDFDIRRIILDLECEKAKLYDERKSLLEQLDFNFREHHSLGDYLISNWEATRTLINIIEPNRVHTLFRMLSWCEKILLDYGLDNILRIVKSNKPEIVFYVFDLFLCRYLGRIIIEREGLYNGLTKIVSALNRTDYTLISAGFFPQEREREHLVSKYDFLDLMEILNYAWYKIPKNVYGLYFNNFFLNVIEGLLNLEKIIERYGVVKIGKELVDIISDIEKELMEPFVKFDLFASKNIINTLEDLRQFRPLLLQLSQYRPISFGESFLKGLATCRISSFQEIYILLDIARAYFELLGDSVYTKKIISEGLGSLRPLDKKIVRLPFKKTGSVLVPLGGRLTGYIIRIIRKQAFEAWEKAVKVGIPCEEIIRVYKRKSKDSEGNELVSVVTKYAGEGILEFIEKYPTLENEVHSQEIKIIKELERNGIIHGHPHHGNFVVLMVNNKPIVRVIDFDMAISPQQ